MFTIVLVAVFTAMFIIFYLCATECFTGDEKQQLKKKLETQGIEFQRLKSRDLLNEQEMMALKRALD